jgi:fructose-1,6-bisphosphatase/inositol monophosphatase family enzyme
MSFMKPKAVATATSAKRSHLLKVYGKVSGAFRRHMGELTRTRMSPTAAQGQFDKAVADLDRVLRENLGATGLPVVTVEQPAPAGAHWVVAPMVSHRNALYGRDEAVCTLVAFIEKDGTCPIGAIMMPMQDICVLAEAGMGAVSEGLGRMRCASRLELNDTLALLPWKTVDVVEFDLMRKLDGENIHTRKSGNTMVDVLDVACGRADMAIATRVNRLEALLTNLVMAERAGFASDMKGKPLGPDSTTMVIANPKLHAKVVGLLK